MKKRHTLFYHIMVFVIAQVAWLALLGIWIYWYVSNYIIFKNVGDKVSPGIIYNATNVFPFVGGIVLLVGIAFSMSLIFRHLNVQIRLNKLYDNFIANITHELKSPLSAIQLYLETLNSRSVSEEKQKEFIGMMMKDSKRLQGLINSILEIAALEQKKISHNYQVYPAAALIRTIIEEVIDQYNLPASSIVFEKNGGAVFPYIPAKFIHDGIDTCECRVDKSAIRIVFDNLTDNSIKYSNDSVKIVIRISVQLSKLVIEFKDKGIGIPSNELKKIFNKFYRVYGESIPNIKGTGLGLYWVREIIRSHYGKISVSSEGLNKGTTFRIELPIYKRPRKILVGKNRRINYA